MSRDVPSNADIAHALQEMGLFLEMDDVPFKPQAYEKAAYAVRALDEPLERIHAEGGGLKALVALPGIGKGIAERIVEMLETGAMADLEALRERTPIDILELTAIEGIGAKKARALFEALEVRSVADLRRAAEAGAIRELPHFGEKSEAKILEGLAFHEEGAGRRPLGEVLELAQRIEAAMAKVPGVTEAAVAGSIRRRRETIGDVDVLVASTEPERVSKAFEKLPEVQAVLAQGPTKTLVRLATGIDADLRVLAPESFGAALLYFTGSKAHNVALRTIARKKKLKLNEYGLFRGEKVVAARTEADVYEALGLEWIPPELREAAGEIERAQARTLPRLIEAGDIRGDLQSHTSWTDGSTSIEAMAEAARELGREYLVITDHTRDLAMTGGLDEARLREQVKAIRAVDRKLEGIRVLAGAEVNIRADGSLDVDDAVLAELDLVGAAIHSHFEQPRAEMTARILRAIENPHVDVLFHPLSRALARRRPVDVDFERLLEACLRTGTILEIDAQPARLDLPDSLARRAIEAGARIAIDSDAHTVDELRFVESFGLGVARRAWAEKEHVVNCLPVEELLALLEEGSPAKTKTKAKAKAKKRAPAKRAPAKRAPAKTRAEKPATRRRTR